MSLSLFYSGIRVTRSLLQLLSISLDHRVDCVFIYVVHYKLRCDCARTALSPRTHTSHGSSFRTSDCRPVSTYSSSMMMDCLNLLQPQIVWRLVVVVGARNLAVRPPSVCRPVNWSFGRSVSYSISPSVSPLFRLTVRWICWLAIGRRVMSHVVEYIGNRARCWSVVLSIGWPQWPVYGSASSWSVGRSTVWSGHQNATDRSAGRQYSVGLHSGDDVLCSCAVGPRERGSWSPVSVIRGLAGSEDNYRLSWMPSIASGHRRIARLSARRHQP